MSFLVGGVFLAAGTVPPGAAHSWQVIPQSEIVHGTSSYRQEVRKKVTVDLSLCQPELNKLARVTLMLRIPIPMVTQERKDSDSR